MLSQIYSPGVTTYKLMGHHEVKDGNTDVWHDM